MLLIDWSTSAIVYQKAMLCSQAAGKQGKFIFRSAWSGAIYQMKIYAGVSYMCRGNLIIDFAS